MGGPIDDDEGNNLRRRRRTLPICNFRLARATPGVILWAGLNIK
jgi:hypothetical protein